MVWYAHEELLREPNDKDAFALFAPSTHRDQREGYGKMPTDDSPSDREHRQYTYNQAPSAMALTTYTSKYRKIPRR